MRIKNFGRTPARVTYATMTFIVDDMGQRSPPPPLTGIQQPIRPFRAFLVSGEEIYHPEVKILGQSLFEVIRNGTKTLYVYGFIDYIDQFKIRHRAGFAGAYQLNLDKAANYPHGGFDQRINVFVLTEPDYNYDRPRKIGEGLDWVGNDPELF